MSDSTKRILSYVSLLALLGLIVTGVGVSVFAERRQLPIQEDAILPALFPLTTRDYIGYLCAIVGLIISAGGGIGGGGKTQL
jgi:hypothetical protein